MEGTSRKTNWVQLVSIVINLILFFEVIFLAIQNRELKTQMSKMTLALNPEPLKKGDRVEPFKVQMFDSTIKNIMYSDTTRGYLFFVLSTTCPFCEKNMVYWQNIYEGMRDREISIIGVSISSIEATKKFITGKNVGFNIASAIIDTSFRRKYKINSVPQTLFIKGNGVVEGNWGGELTSKQIEEITKINDVVLTSLK